MVVGFVCHPSASRRPAICSRSDSPFIPSLPHQRFLRFPVCWVLGLNVRPVNESLIPAVAQDPMRPRCLKGFTFSCCVVQGVAVHGPREGSGASEGCYGSFDAVARADVPVSQSDARTASGHNEPSTWERTAFVGPAAWGLVALASRTRPRFDDFAREAFLLALTDRPFSSEAR